MRYHTIFCKYHTATGLVRESHIHLKAKNCKEAQEEAIKLFSSYSRKGRVYQISTIEATRGMTTEGHI
jgi:hypothetical protein